MDPQQRLFLELCWECLERAGHAPDGTRPGAVGVFAGMYGNSYFQHHLLTHPELFEQLGDLPVALANDKDYIATRVAYKLNLTGPAINVQTACSTSLVADRPGLLGAPQRRLRHGAGRRRLGHLPAAAAATSTRKARCSRPTATAAASTPTRRARCSATAPAVVLLKRLADALADGDPIHAVIRGAAINNDGAVKAGFTAPSVDGQARGGRAPRWPRPASTPRSISYVEAHGTATPLGDPIEIAALAKAFGGQHRRHRLLRRRLGQEQHRPPGRRRGRDRPDQDRAGAARTGDPAVAALRGAEPGDRLRGDALPRGRPAAILAARRDAAARRRQLLRRRRHQRARDRRGSARGAAAEAGSGPQLLQLSARTPSALAAAVTRLADHLAARPDTCWPTSPTRCGSAARPSASAPSSSPRRSRRRSPRCAPKARRSRAAGQLRGLDARRRLHVPRPGRAIRRHGQRAACPGTRHSARAFDDCLAAFEGHLDFDLRERLLVGRRGRAEADLGHPAGHLRARIRAGAPAAWRSASQPAALIGHSVGEFAAAVLAGVMSLADAARLVARRGALMQAHARGRHAVGAPAGRRAARSCCPPACRWPPRTARPPASSPARPSSSKASASSSKPPASPPLLQTSHAFHSSMMEGAVAPFEALVRQVRALGAAHRHPFDADRPPAERCGSRSIPPTGPATCARRCASRRRRCRCSTASPIRSSSNSGPRSTLATLVRQQASRQRPVSARQRRRRQPGAGSALPGAWPPAGSGRSASSPDARRPRPPPAQAAAAAADLPVRAQALLGRRRRVGARRACRACGHAAPFHAVRQRARQPPSSRLPPHRFRSCQ